MNAAFTPSRMRISVERYQKMVATGVLTPEDRVELIEGEIVDMAPIGTRHARVTGRLNKRCVLGLGDQAIVRLANPVDLGAFSEPEPDLMLLRCSPILNRSTAVSRRSAPLRQGGLLAPLAFPTLQIPVADLFA